MAVRSKTRVTDQFVQSYNALGFLKNKILGNNDLYRGLTKGFLQP